ncbi:hypothetical protein [Alkalitalea saponilacus]|uniref:HEAT repeat-containing protein n=1 Tax=Alkalitalea saponilacus TaxID=889453 RepID=A0A1T5HCK3_9BACT|nr:hypothetical protein [Alkalitalea saponilacus]ASB50760.1 hypothetical protein CDL62_17180 [Alkalitalea saponilacus]SKC18251.1 hypothetical protein SAMN03080601_02223 [Alkalitalea saponilacus]
MNWNHIIKELKSGEESRLLAKQLFEQQEGIPIVIKCITNRDKKVAWRAAWILDNFSRENHKMLIPFVNRFCEILISTPHQGVRRHLTNILCAFPAETIEDGRVVDACLKWITEEKSDIAVKANAMQLVANICRVYPELASEIINVIEQGMENGSPGIKNRGEKIIASLEPLITSTIRQNGF